ncbi:MAG: N-acetyl-gamma-glutamyl-phosphate reductase [Rikenellaceae bacterium]|nr:N-acetyl-gamma-glutamyl-phosphate reductase [Rikenellaceae bacterium]MCL2692079.1 N-acetyl-gamma-glutamyl-phosphate reductase [Rikenellaceae bacterium]
MKKIAIAGGTGYTAGELLRLLLRHPSVEVGWVLSTTQAGESVAAVHRDLLGDTSLRFSETLPADARPDVIFLALGHGLSRGYLDGLNLPPQCRVIDLGNDFRLDAEYGGREFIYGLTEARPGEIAAARNIANPGCFATAILLPLLPLAAHGLLTDEVHVHAVTGSTGAGKSLSETTHFSYRADNMSVYKPFAHQHLGEIRKTLGGAAQINFVPMRGGFTRGIFASIYTRAQCPPEVFEEYYRTSPFVHISREPISMKEVVNTNKALIHVEAHDGYLHLTCAIDNLLKGASGQAVQNMNLMLGLPETAGLQLKATCF